MRALRQSEWAGSWPGEATAFQDWHDVTEAGDAEALRLFRALLEWRLALWQRLNLVEPTDEEYGHLVERHGRIVRDFRAATDAECH